MADEEGAPAPRKRGRSAASATTARSSSPTRRRRVGGAELVETLNEMVSQLIKENRTLKRQLARLTAGGATTATNGSAERTLRSLQRKVQRAVSATPTTRRRRSSASATTTPRARSTRRRSTAAE